MNCNFIVHKKIRENLKNILLETPSEYLFTIPEGFNNHIFWNIAHCVATQQLLCYYLTGNDFRVDIKWIDNYKKGTFPNFNELEDDIENLALILKETSIYFEEDFEDDIFDNYKPYTTSFGIELVSIEDAIVYNNMHESMHYGYALAQRKILLEL